MAFGVAVYVGGFTDCQPLRLEGNKHTHTLLSLEMTVQMGEN